MQLVLNIGLIRGHIGGMKVAFPAPKPKKSDARTEHVAFRVEPELKARFHSLLGGHDRAEWLRDLLIAGLDHLERSKKRTG